MIGRTDGECQKTSGGIDDMINAGTEWVDQTVVRDGNLISSLMPGDLPVFCRTIIDMLTP